MAVLDDSAILTNFAMSKLYRNQLTLGQMCKCSSGIRRTINALHCLTFVLQFNVVVIIVVIVDCCYCWYQAATGRDMVTEKTRIQNLKMIPAISGSATSRDCISMNPTWTSGHSYSLQIHAEESGTHLPGRMNKDRALWEAATNPKF